MSPSPDETTGPAEDPSDRLSEGREEPGMRCDFCGRLAPRVRRIALDAGYDRLQVRHAERYACPPCSERKERQRQARS